MSHTQESSTAVSVRDLDVRFRVYQERQLSMRELVARGFRSREAVEVHALRSISLEIKVGEALGLVGSNGSGKSTLLRSIAGLQSKTSGCVLVRGNAHLLGVHAALKPRLSGFHNVFLGGLAMGLELKEIEDKMDSVVEFAGLEDAIGRPMETYSSGMKARLAFSIATIRVPEVLLIDEALAVGDKQFKERSLARIQEIRREANTVIMVTHSLDEIRRTCTRAAWLEQGTLRAEGDVEEVLEMYERSAG